MADETNAFFEFFKNNFGDIAGLATSAYGYNKLMENVGTARSNLTDDIETLTTDATAAGEFVPATVRGMYGNTSYNADTGQTSFNLNQVQQNQANFQRQGANTMFGRALQDPAQRETDVYNRIRAMQQPEEERQYSSMNANLFGSGRGGMSSAEYGGSPEQFAFGKAQAEARNAASLQAMQQAQSEMMNYANIGQTMFGNQYMPGEQLRANQALGIQQAGLANQSNQAMAGLIAQLGLGGITADVNYANVQGNALTGLLEAIAAAVGGAG